MLSLFFKGGNICGDWLLLLLQHDHNKKWIMIQVNDEKYYFETVKEADLENMVYQGHIYFDKDELNDGKSILIFTYDNSKNEWKARSVSKQVIEIGSKYEILYTNYDIKGEFLMFKPYLRYVRNCLNVSDVLAFCVVMFSVLISIYILKKSRCII